MAKVLAARRVDLALAGDAALAAGFVVLGQVDLWRLHTAINTGSARASAPAVAIATLALAWRRRAPLAGLAVVLAATTVTGLFVDMELVFWGGLVPIAIALYSVAHHARGRGPLAGALMAAGGTVLIAVQDRAGRDPSEVTFEAVVLGLAWAAGYAMNVRDRQGEVLADRVAEQEQRARDAAGEERTRIARELHDVVAHSVSVMVVQAGAARMMLDRDPAAAREALTQIEQAGRQTVGELRHLLGLLRQQDEDLALAPQPTLRHLDALLAQVRDVGLAVELTVEGTAHPLPLGVEVSAYRIVQEALTNTLKHAGPARASVLLRYGPESLDVEVVDDGQVASDGTGHGLVGMRERVAMFGGDLQAGPRPGGGFGLRARLPLQVAAP